MRKLNVVHGNLESTRHSRWGRVLGPSVANEKTELSSKSAAYASTKAATDVVKKILRRRPRLSPPLQTVTEGFVILPGTWDVG